MKSIKWNWQFIILLVLLGTLISSFFLLDPFCNLLVSNKAPVSQLNAFQRANIELASKKLNGCILKPGQSFSFNSVVGPRGAEQGYSKSPSYLEGDSPMTFGGGICLLSSLLYKSALELDFKIKERHPHTRTTQSIPPGFDAAVWYGRCDLSFTNNHKSAIKIESCLDSQNLTVNFYGSENPNANQPVILDRLVKRVDRHSIAVTVLRREMHQAYVVSKDLYRITRQSFDIAQNKAN